MSIIIIVSGMMFILPLPQQVGQSNRDGFPPVTPREWPAFHKHGADDPFSFALSLMFGSERRKSILLPRIGSVVCVLQIPTLPLKLR